MATENRPPRDHSLLIIRLYKQGHSEEQIAEELCSAGVETTFLDVLQHLETAGVIPCPSPVHSKDEDSATHQVGRCRRARLGVTCHHGETSHISRTNLAHIPSDPTPIEKYQQDTQKHEEFACGYRQPPVESSLDSWSVIDPDSDIESFRDGELSEVFKQFKNKRKLINPSAPRLERPTLKRVRVKNRVQKRPC